ncbi:hypothetical protein [Prevotella corporis]|uniref:hypothetical protein n=1 Tax=Prevotella corporis TaxID=28128 RepID=UPI0023F845CB|nr:hypothetical protein [Prevotella corporis]
MPIFFVDFLPISFRFVSERFFAIRSCCRICDGVGLLSCFFHRSSEGQFRKVIFRRAKAHLLAGETSPIVE